MEFLIAVDMEGIHGVVGEPNVRYSETADYKLAIGYAAKEVNAVTDIVALFVILLYPLIAFGNG